MYVREEATKLLLSGLRPSELADKMRKDIIEIKRYLLTQVGEGQLRLSDILFSIPLPDRVRFETVIRQYPGKSHSELRSVRLRPFKANSLEEGEFRIYQVCRDSERGDMYVFLSDIEITLHNLVKRALAFQFGDGEDGWWRQGVPSQIRKACVSVREEDPAPCQDAFAYTTFINLREIVDKNWGLFVHILPKEFQQNKKSFLEDLVKLNHLRNGVMHPIKRIEISKDDFSFVKSFRKAIDESNWCLSAQQVTAPAAFSGSR